MRTQLVTNDLCHGLRALMVLARHAPLELGEFAALGGFSWGEATALVGAFEQTGYVARVPHCGLLFLTPLALNAVPPISRLH